MASYYTQISFFLRCTMAEQPLIAAAINGLDPLAGDENELAPVVAFLRQHFRSDKHDDHWISAEAEIEDQPDGVSIWSSDCSDLDAVAAAIQSLAPSALPFGFTYALTCTRPCLDAYSGGYMFITREGYDGLSSDQSLRIALAGVRG